MKRYLTSAALLLVFSAWGVSAASARCISLPDNASSHYLSNQRDTVICFNRELGDRVRGTEQQSRFENLQRRLDRMQVERRFDALPRPGFSR